METKFETSSVDRSSSLAQGGGVTSVLTFFGDRFLGVLGGGTALSPPPVFHWFFFFTGGGAAWTTGGAGAGWGSDLGAARPCQRGGVDDRRGCWGRNRGCYFDNRYSGYIVDMADQQRTSR